MVAQRVTTDLLAEMLAHAAACEPAECCGLLVDFGLQGGLRYVPAQNLRAGQRDRFELDPLTWPQCEDAGGEVLAVVHSHPNASANPSMADRKGCEAGGVPWLIVGWPSGALVELQPCGWSAPLIGREFCFGVLDCYSLVQDFYRTELGLVLPDFEREPGFWRREQLPDGTWREARHLYRDGLATAGFSPVHLAPGEMPQRGDGLLMRIRSQEVENHAAVYLGDGMMLHHLIDQPSRRERWDEPWQKRTTGVVRHHALAGGAS